MDSWKAVNIKHLNCFIYTKTTRICLPEFYAVLRDVYGVISSFILFKMVSFFAVENLLIVENINIWRRFEVTLTRRALRA